MHLSSEDQPGLSRREYQILQCMARDLAPREMAAELGLSVKTVSTYRQRLLDKNRGINGNVGLVLEGIRCGLLTVDGVQATPPPYAAVAVAAGGE